MWKLFSTSSSSSWAPYTGLLSFIWNPIWQEIVKNGKHWQHISQLLFNLLFLPLRERMEFTNLLPSSGASSSYDSPSDLKFTSHSASGDSKSGGSSSDSKFIVGNSASGNSSSGDASSGDLSSGDLTSGDLSSGDFEAPVVMGRSWTECFWVEILESKDMWKYYAKECVNNKQTWSGRPALSAHYVHIYFIWCSHVGHPAYYLHISLHIVLNIITILFWHFHFVWLVLFCVW